MDTEIKLDKPLYTVYEIAKMFKVSRQGIYFKMRAGEIEGLKLGRKWLVPHDSLIKYLNREQVIK